MEEKSPGQVGYEAYGEQQSWLNYQGLPMPTWSEVPEDIKQAWEVAAAAVLAYECEG